MITSQELNFSLAETWGRIVLTLHGVWKLTRFSAESATDQSLCTTSTSPSRESVRFEESFRHRIKNFNDAIEPENVNFLDFY